ncbi:MAG TPA: elongation factor P [Firmicutes bacterium]|nr:elongation factor P [Bacillota bacterium]
MISTNDFRPGITVEVDGDIWMVVEAQHVKPGKGSAFVRTRLKNVKTGAVLDRTFAAGERFPQAHLERREMQYLYESGGQYFFMDTGTYEQIQLDKDKLGDTVLYMKENSILYVLMYEGVPLGAELPNFVELEVVETDPGLKGDTATGGTKPARLETGAVVKVPLFVEVGDVIRVDTRTHQYLERV